MIRSVRGIVLQQGKGYLVIEIGAAAGGLGLRVFTPENTSAQYQSGASVVLYTYLQVREDALSLYGFTTEDELATFELLLGVNGVGPRVALATLNTLSPDMLRMAIANDEPALVARVPGVGKRTAQKIVLDLKDKVATPAGSLGGLVQLSNVDSEVIDALTSLGYSVVEAQRAVQKLPKEAVGVEERLRLALSQFDH
ncbi:MAG: Holliday junction branch migration protein RuvA [Caldilineaceae bacterium]|nr:Holliday junction branch migration protein RuvA [Caldilineaceae bacterium]